MYRLGFGCLQYFGDFFHCEGFDLRGVSLWKLDAAGDAHVFVDILHLIGEGEDGAENRCVAFDGGGSYVSFSSVPARLFVIEVLNELLDVVCADVPHPHRAEHWDQHFFYDTFIEGIGRRCESRSLDLKVFFAEFCKSDSVGALLNTIQFDFFLKGFYEGVDLFVELLVGEVGLGGLENF